MVDLEIEEVNKGDKTFYNPIKLIALRRNEELKVDNVKVPGPTDSSPVPPSTIVKTCAKPVIDHNKEIKMGLAFKLVYQRYIFMEKKNPIVHEADFLHEVDDVYELMSKWFAKCVEHNMDIKQVL